jgi:RNA polymerase-binding transcription factor DksA
MPEKIRMKRVGKYWMDRALLDEGYELADIVDVENVMIELPELIDPVKLRNVGWIRCPDCDEISQVDRRQPMCTHCDWEQELDADASEMKINLVHIAKARDLRVERELRQDSVTQLGNNSHRPCKECGVDIGRRRLEAMPGTNLCLHCKQDLEMGIVFDSMQIRSAA